MGRITILLLTAAWLTGCGKDAPPPKPELPKIAAPSWNLGAYDAAPPPPGLPASTQPPTCWKAAYNGTPPATVWVCGYPTGGGAFDAVQRTATGANTVKFEEDRYLVIASCPALNDPAARDGFQNLVRAIQQKLKSAAK